MYSLRGQLIDHLLDKPIGAVVDANEEKYVADVHANGAGVSRTPLELIHEAQALPVEVDGHEPSVGVEHRRAAVATHL